MAPAVPSPAKIRSVSVQLSTRRAVLRRGFFRLGAAAGIGRVWGRLP